MWRAQLRHLHALRCRGSKKRLTGSIEATRGERGRRKTGRGKDAMRKMGEGRRNEFGGRRWERRKEEGRFQTVQSAYLPFQPFGFSSVDNHVGSDG